MEFQSLLLVFGKVAAFSVTVAGFSVTVAGFWGKVLFQSLLRSVFG